MARLNIKSKSSAVAAVNEKLKSLQLGDNPKKAFGDAKPSAHFAPLVVMLAVYRVFALGAHKYGLMNWRVQAVTASTYYDAIIRHLTAWFDGVDNDDESGESHLAHVIACAMILLDAAACGKLIDDRKDAEAKTMGVGR